GPERGEAMEGIVLRDDLRKMIEEDVAQEAKSVSELVNEAVEHYVVGRQRAKLDQEIAAYEALYPELVQKHPGRWVAIHGRQLVDCDADGSALAPRVHAKYGRTPVLVRQVTSEPADEVWLRRPSVGRRTR